MPGASNGLFLDLEILLLGENNINKLPANFFNCTNWTLMQNLYLSYNQLEMLPKYAFYSSAERGIWNLYIEHNKITLLPEELFYSPNLKRLSQIFFSHNQITDLPNLLFHSPHLQQLRWIDLSYNKINNIPSRFFEKLNGLETLYLNNNNLKSISEDMLPSPLNQTHLCELRLAHNKISSVGEIVQTLFIDSNSQSFSCNLDLSHNHLSVQQTNFIQPYDRKGYLKAYLNLSNNDISKFQVTSGYAKQSEPYITIPLDRQFADTSGNKIFSVVNLVEAAMGINLNNINQELSAYLKLSAIFRLHVLIQAFSFKYDCNCDMLKYKEIQRTDQFNKSLAYFKLAITDLKSLKKYNHLKLFDIPNNLICGSPKHLYGKHLYQLKDIELQCEHSRCTDNNSCTCVETPYNGTVRIHCSRRNITQMPLITQNASKLQIYLEYNHIYEIPIANIALAVKVVLLDLSHNFITTIPILFFHHYQNLTHLNLAGNCLNTLPFITEWKNFNSLHVLEFRGNNFTCNCSGLQLKQTLGWLNARSNCIVKDLDQIKCSYPSAVEEKVIYQLPDPLFGCPFVNLVLILTLTLSMLLFFSFVIFIGYVFRYYISLFLFVHFGWRFCYSYTNDETLYDAFISYSSKDSEWVIDQLVNPLENLDPPYNLCLHERDFLVGVPICDNISKATEGSKCTICVVSKNWLESDWCQFEFRVAHCLATVEKKTRLLVILKEEIPKDKIEGDLKFYMKTFTYLDSAHPLFWSRLLNDLPRPDVELKEVREENELTLLLK